MRVTHGDSYLPTQMESVVGSNAAGSWARSRSDRDRGSAHASTSRVTTFMPQMPAGVPGPEMNHARPSPTANGRKLEIWTGRPDRASVEALMNAAMAWFGGDGSTALSHTPANQAIAAFISASTDALS